jgi:hypothetical protein
MKNKVARQTRLSAMDFDGTIESVKESMYLEAMRRPKRPRYTLPKMGLKYNVECFFNYTVCYLGAKVALVIGNNEYKHLPSLETPTSVVLVATKLIKMLKFSPRSTDGTFFLVAMAVALMARQSWRRLHL